jgi:hypothetical protein
MMLRSLLARLVSIAALVSLAASPAGAEDAPAAPNRWNDRAFLESVVPLACEAVEQVTGATFPRRPTLAFSDEKALADLLVEEMSGIFERLGAANDAQVRTTAETLAKALMAKYAPATNLIHLSVENVERLTEFAKEPQARTEGLMRVLLAHECAHALDFQRFPALEEQRQSRETMDGIQAVGAVLEGHAQFVAQRVAEKWGLRTEFETLTRLIAVVPPIEDPVQRQLAALGAAETQFAYVQGQAFFEAVFAARGRAGVEAVLANPPEATAHIEEPSLHLDPASGRPLDTTAPFAAVRRALGEAWPLRAVPLKRASVEASFALLPPERRAALVAFYRDGEALAGAKDGAQVVFALMRWRGAEGAACYLQEVRALHEIKDVAMKEGPIHIAASQYFDVVGEGRPGLRVRKVVMAGTETQVVTVHHAVHGDLALEAMFLSTDLDDAGEAALVEAALVSLESLGAPAPAGAGGTK